MNASQAANKFGKDVSSLFTTYNNASDRAINNGISQRKSIASINASNEAVKQSKFKRNQAQEALKGFYDFAPGNQIGAYRRSIQNGGKFQQDDYVDGRLQGIDNKILSKFPNAAQLIKNPSMQPTSTAPVTPEAKPIVSDNPNANILFNKVSADGSMAPLPNTSDSAILQNAGVTQESRVPDTGGIFTNPPIVNASTDGQPVGTGVEPTPKIDLANLPPDLASLFLGNNELTRYLGMPQDQRKQFLAEHSKPNFDTPEFEQQFNRARKYENLTRMALAGVSPGAVQGVVNDQISNANKFKEQQAQQAYQKGALEIMNQMLREQQEAEQAQGVSFDPSLDQDPSLTASPVGPEFEDNGRIPVDASGVQRLEEQTVTPIEDFFPESFAGTPEGIKLAERITNRKLDKNSALEIGALDPSDYTPESFARFVQFGRKNPNILRLRGNKKAGKQTPLMVLQEERRRIEAKDPNDRRLTEINNRINNLTSSGNGGLTKLARLQKERAAVETKDPNSPLLEDYDRAIQKATTSSALVQNNLGNQETSFDKEFGKLQAQDYSKIQQAGRDSKKTVTKLKQLKELLSNVETGTFKPVTNKFLLAVKDLGINVPESANQVQAADALINGLALSLRSTASGEGLPGATSDRDINFLLAQLASSDKSPEANERILGMAIALEERKAKIAKLAREYTRKNGGRFDEHFEDFMEDWAEKNPLFDVGQAGSNGVGGATGNVLQDIGKGIDINETLKYPEGTVFDDPNGGPSVELRGGKLIPYDPNKARN